MMEHVNIEYIGAYLYLTPFDGYLLHNTKTDTLHSEATVKSLKNWEAVRVEDIVLPEPSDDDVVSDAEALNIILGL